MIHDENGFNGAKGSCNLEEAKGSRPAKKGAIESREGGKVERAARARSVEAVVGEGPCVSHLVFSSKRKSGGKEGGSVFNICT